MARSRRKAREAALQSLYKIEIAKSPISTAVEEMRLENQDLSPDILDYAEGLISGVRSNQARLDGMLSALIKQYDYDRVAVVDKMALRIGAYELFFEETIPPAVTIDEAIEISRKFSTYESGKFVNGVLGKLLEQSPKANWDPAAAPPEYMEEPVHEEPPPEETISADSEEAQELSKVGGWRLRSPDLDRKDD